ncbi:glycosyltransferase family 2 protein [Candidatus Roizmanbacteria bacterium]|nr:glycosyltransferase family 2 protein [Candidatus Roizmanbacteria bacterium]
MKKALSIIIPIHNEEAILHRQVFALLTQLENSLTIPYEIVLVENGSTDRTKSLVTILATYSEHIRVVSLRHASYGAAVRKGLQQARYPIVAQFDIDFWDVAFLRRAMTLISRYDVVIGSKNIPGAVDERPFTRRLTSKLFEYCIGVRFNLPIKDTHGMKVLLRKKMLPLIDVVVSPNHFFDTELLIQAFYAGCSWIELPVVIHEIRKSRFPFRKRFFQVLREGCTLFMRPLGLPTFSKAWNFRLFSSVSIFQFIIDL